ncbi:DUF2252 family protein [Pseudorhodoferax sp. Leaf265]|uniref:DUF2252 family protein n=1 Tax=Pseudorhodoferax sp. Leaf265 TaxID=1736315 RepID=UPI0006FE0F67|nr:DUF2252 family protein [Pseudorhodoferax sp. Leaf265]KQP15562.1 hypothetical protein ASF45_28615 [Pseudorhodoferax sp. Leaf265]
MQTIIEDAAAYEGWLRGQCDVVESGIKKKHELMSEDPFRFLRATYFRWAKTAPVFAGHLARAPLALCVGDAHAENFGTWVDAEGRRVWGVNDFDEAARMPYPLDLVRLLVSAWLAKELDVGRTQATRAVLTGYLQGLKSPGPVLVEHGDDWFRELLAGLATTADSYWAQYREFKSAKPPEGVRAALLRALPPGTQGITFLRKQKGGGSLGRPRFYALGQWRGGTVAREAKASVPSAWDWSAGDAVDPRGTEMEAGTYRSPDASLTRSGKFIIRRVAPDARKLDLGDVAKQGRGPALLRAMAADLAAIHAASVSTEVLVQHLRQLPEGWLTQAAELAEAIVRSDFQAWNERRARRPPGEA